MSNSEMQVLDDADRSASQHQSLRVDQVWIVDGQHRTLCLRQLWEWYEFLDADSYTPASTCVGCAEALESRACDKCHTSIMLESHGKRYTVSNICTDTSVSANG